MTGGTAAGDNTNVGLLLGAGHRAGALMRSGAGNTGLQDQPLGSRW